MWNAEGLLVRRFSSKAVDESNRLATTAPPFATAEAAAFRAPSTHCKTSSSKIQDQTVLNRLFACNYPPSGCTPHRQNSAHPQNGAQKGDKWWNLQVQFQPALLLPSSFYLQNSGWIEPLDRQRESKERPILHQSTTVALHLSFFSSTFSQ